jgi:hypothetical protein
LGRRSDLGDQLEKEKKKQAREVKGKEEGFFFAAHLMSRGEVGRTAKGGIEVEQDFGQISEIFSSFSPIPL